MSVADLFEEFCNMANIAHVGNFSEPTL